MEKFLADVPLDNVKALFEDKSGPGSGLSIRAVLETAAYCRIACATRKDATDPVSPETVPPQIISQTQRASRGRPRTGRWAFWAAFIIDQDSKYLGKPLSRAFLAKLICILLNRPVSSDEVRRVFVGLRKEAREHAVATAQEILNDELKRGLGEKKFRLWIENYLGEDLRPDSHMPPTVINGKVNQDWLDQVMQVRRKIFRRVRSRGPLGGTEPDVRVCGAVRIVKGYPLIFPPVHDQIHLGKGVDAYALTPNRVLSPVSISFSIDEGEPYTAAIYSVPKWSLELTSSFMRRPATDVESPGPKTLLSETKIGT